MKVDSQINKSVISRLIEELKKENYIR